MHLILGDSTSQQLDDQKLSLLSGEDWFNLSFGGSTLAESLEALEYVLDHHEVDSIYFNLPLRRLEADTRNTLPNSIEIAECPYLHFLSLEAIRASYYVLKTAMGGEHNLAVQRGLEREELFNYFLDRSRQDLQKPAGRPENWRF